MSAFAERTTFFIVKLRPTSTVSNQIWPFEYKKLSIDVGATSSGAIDEKFRTVVDDLAGWSLLNRAETKLVPGTKLIYVEAVIPAQAGNGENLIDVNQLRRMRTSARVLIGQQQIKATEEDVRIMAGATQQYKFKVFEVQKGVSVDLGVDGTMAKFTGADERKLDGTIGVLIVRSEDQTNVGLTTDALSFPLFKGQWSIDTVALFSEPNNQAANDENPKVTLGQALTYKLVLGPKWNDFESDRSFVRGQIALSFSVGLKGFDVSNIQSIKSFDTKPFFGLGIQLRF